MAQVVKAAWIKLGFPWLKPLSDCQQWLFSVAPISTQRSYSQKGKWSVSGQFVMFIQNMCFCPYLWIKSVGVRSCRASSVSRSSFLRVSTLASVSLVVVNHVLNLKLAIVVRKKKMLTIVFNASAGYNRVMTHTWLQLPSHVFNPDKQVYHSHADYWVYSNFSVGHF